PLSSLSFTFFISLFPSIWRRKLKAQSDTSAAADARHNPTSPLSPFDQSNTIPLSQPQTHACTHTHTHTHIHMPLTYTLDSEITVTRFMVIRTMGLILDHFLKFLLKCFLRTTNVIKTYPPGS